MNRRANAAQMTTKRIEGAESMLKAAERTRDVPKMPLKLMLFTTLFAPVAGPHTL